MQQGQNLKEEEDHLIDERFRRMAIVWNVFPRSFMHAANPSREDNGEREEENLPTVLLCDVASISESIRSVSN